MVKSIVQKRYSQSYRNVQYIIKKWYSQLYRDGKGVRSEYIATQKCEGC